MTWLLFLDESGHDHKNCPYEVRGGLAIRSDHLWPLLQEVRRICQIELGCTAAVPLPELKGARLLSRDRWKIRSKLPLFSPSARRQLAGECLSLPSPPTRSQYVAYAQSGFVLVGQILDLLYDHEVRVIATALPRGTAKSLTLPADFLRKDYVFLLQRFAFLLADRDDNGVLVFDQSEEKQDGRFLRQIENYFTRTVAGRTRSQRVIPIPLFVSSAMTLPVQLADICLYCINWGYRLPERGMNAPERAEIAQFASKIRRLVHQSSQEGRTTYSITPVFSLT